MRVAGTILLLGGFLLCVSIVWAAVGLAMIGFGLVCLLIAERPKKSIAVVVTLGLLSTAIKNTLNNVISSL